MVFNLRVIGVIQAKLALNTPDVSLYIFHLGHYVRRHMKAAKLCGLLFQDI